MKLCIFSLLAISFISMLMCSCADCGYENVQVIHGLKNYQSVIGFVSNCGATTAEGINVMFVRPGMNLGRSSADVFAAELSMDLFLQRISEDSVKVIFSASEDRILKQEKEVYGVHFIYENNGRFFNKKRK